MKLKALSLDLEAGGKLIVVLNKDTAEDMSLHALDRVKLEYDDQEITAIMDIAEKTVSRDEVGLYRDVYSELDIEEGSEIEVRDAKPPESVEYIKEKVSGRSLSHSKVRSIVRDVVDGNLSDVELTSFVTSLDLNGVSLEEAEFLSRSMAEGGDILEMDRHPIYDKHSIGGVCGDKTSMLLVPIVAYAGLTIPKTSSKAITSPAGTANRMGVLTDVELDLDEIKETVNKTNGCIVWGGAVDLAPADDLFIQVEYPIGIDPLLLPSIMAKKKSVNAGYVVIDIPTGRGAKIKTIEEAQELAEDFIELGKRLGIEVKCASTYGEQPLGYAMGPALEAKETLETLNNISKTPDLVEKVTSLAGILLETSGEKDGKKKAMQILKNGNAEKKFREIINTQGGDPNINAKDIQLGEKTVDIKSKDKGRVLWLSNPIMRDIARKAGAPKDEGAGVLLNKKMGDKVKEGEKLFTIYSESSSKMDSALEIVENDNPFLVSKELSRDMVLERMPSGRRERHFFLER
ncbi:MAG: AMP phosphorylase [Candidatus Aenigmatarchaeota archaeon]